MFNPGFSDLIGVIQIFFVIVVGLYFWNLLRSQQGTRLAVDRESKKEMEKLQRLRKISLAEPLAEKTRPQRFEEIVGQDDGLKALRAALCGQNPQHCNRSFLKKPCGPPTPLTVYSTEWDAVHQFHL